MKYIIDKIDILKNKQLGCIEVNLMEDNACIYHLVVLKQEKNKINFEKVICNIDSFEVLSSHLSRNLPLAVVLTGKGIIFRNIESANDENNIDILRKILPNAVPADFYIERTESGNNETSVSIIRKEIAEKFLNTFKEKKLFVIDLFIGPYIINPVINIIDPLLETINLGTYQIKLGEGKIISCSSKISENEEIINVGEEKVSNYALLALSAGITMFANNFSSIHPDVVPVQINNEEFKSFRLMKIAGMGMLVVFFLILLINYFIFDSYNSRHNDLTSRLTEYQGFLSNYKIQKTDLEEKKTLLTETGLLQPSKISFYADRIAANLPSGISLTELNINPKTSKKNDQKKIDFSKNKITIEGYTTKGSILYEWLKTIEGYEWVEEVSKFTINSEDGYKNQMAGFTIDIEIK